MADNVLADFLISEGGDMVQRLCRNAVCVLCCFAFQMPFVLGQVPSVQHTKAKPDPAREVAPKSADQQRGARPEEAKAAPTVAIRQVSITTTEDGLWRWQVEFIPTISRRIEPNTVKVKVWQNADTHPMLVDTRVYDRPVIPPAGGRLQNAFFPCGFEDSLLFELIEVKPGGALNPNADQVVDRKTAAMPPMNVEIGQYGYTLTDPGTFYVGLKNKSAWPLLVRVVIRGGKLIEWTRVRHTEHLILPANAEKGVRHVWPFTDKGMGKYMYQLETQFKDASTGKVLWKEIEHKEGNLPTNR